MSMQSMSKKQDETDTSISEISDSPYKSMSEKEILFKVLDKHSEAMKDRKKRQAYQHKQGFLRGLLNDHGLVWEMKNIPTRASNYSGIAVLRSAYDGNENYQSRQER